MTRREGEVLHLEGPITLDTVPALVDEGAVHLAAGVRRIDFAGVTDVDSSAVALALEWQRRSVPHALSFHNAPEALRNLAQLYGVSDLLRIGAP
jgi:phospholipid transport system transporter-binding protein